MAKRGRPTNTNSMIKQFSKKENVVGIGNEPLIIPNHSGQHEAGRIDNVNERDNAIVNKKYVDDKTEGFLKLDCSNDPLTGDLQLSQNLIVDGNVGIGTNNPSEKLHINVPSPKIFLERTNSVNALGEIQFAGNDDVVSMKIKGYTYLGEGMTFWTEGFSREAVERMRIDTDGNVGIGTDSPIHPLDVEGEGNWGTISSFTGDGTYGTSRITINGVSGDDTQLGFMHDGSTKWSIGNNADNDYFHIQDGAGSFGASKFVIDTDGDVGIGTTTPSEKLEVNGNIKVGANGYTTIGDNLFLTDDGYINIDDHVTDMELTLKGDEIKINNNRISGGMWARNILAFANTSDDSYFQLGALGDLQEVIYGYLGDSYNSPQLKFYDGKLALNDFNSGSLTLDLEVGTDMHLYGDNRKLFWGASGDSSINYDGSDMIFNSQEVGSGDFVFNNGNVIIETKTPSSSSDTGTTGTVCWDADYVYVCTATNTWKRAGLSSW